MGMDFRYQGSASYPRFDREMEEIAAIFGGKLLAEIAEKKEYDEQHRTLDFWFGYTSNDQTDKPKFVFEKKQPKTLMKFFNNPYGDFTPKETKFIWDKISQHPEIEKISSQIWEELKMLVKYDEGWYIT